MKNEHSELIMGFLTGTLNAQDTERFYAWIAASPENKELFFDLKAVYDACQPDRTPSEIEQSWTRLQTKKHKTAVNPMATRSFFQHWLPYASVAVLTAFVTLSLVHIFSGNKTPQESAYYMAGNGLEANRIKLQDGTEISIGSKTTFYCNPDYGKSQRIVYLEGEAFFDVAKLEDKPFIVKVKGQDIEAIGTQFNVMAYPEDSLLTTTLLEGCVKLACEQLSGFTYLKPNQQYIYNKNNNTGKVEKVNARQFTKWTTGYYYFPEQTFEAILYRMSHVYGITFDIESEELKNKVFTGTFYRGQSVKNIMEIINLSIPIDYCIDDHYVKITEKTCN